jgi:hypothetical protein
LPNQAIIEKPNNLTHIVEAVRLLFKKPDAASLSIHPNVPLQNTGRETHIQNILNTVRLLFKKPETQIRKVVHNEHTVPLSNLLNVIVRLFEKPNEEETPEPKRKWPNILDFLKDGKRKRQIIEYEPDYNAEKCMELLDGNPLKDLYEPVNTYEDKTTNMGVCVFKLKSMNKEDEDKLSEEDKKIRDEAEETIKKTYPIGKE